MSDTVAPLFQWLHAHPHLAGLATFIISAAESVAIIGTVVPGTIMMTALGTLAGAGVIPLWSTIFWAILGAIAGDGISYWMGYYFKDRLPLLWPFRKYPGFLKSGERFFYRYGAMSVFIGRFVGPVRAIVPLVAGMLGMRPLVFTIANVASAIGWAPAYMLPGILLGAASQELPPDIAIHVILVLLLMGLFIALCLWFLYKLFNLVRYQVVQWENRVWKRLERSEHFHATTVILKHHDKDKTHGQFTLAIFLLISVTCFLLLAGYVKYHGPASITLNDTLYHLFRGLNNRSLQVDTIMIYITLLGQKQILIPVMLVLMVYFLLIRRYRVALHVLGLGLLTGGSIYVIKHLLKIPRPWGIVESPQSYSMPSGHTALSSVFYGAFALLLARQTPNWLLRRTLYTVTISIILAVSISRLYLGAHWLTDIISSWLLAISILLFVIISFQRQFEKPLDLLALFSITLLTLVVGYGIYFNKNIDRLITAYSQERLPIKTIAMSSWWQKNGSLPTYYTSLFGYPSQFINIQWIGNLQQIEDTLSAQGWKQPPARDFVSTLHRIADVSSTQYLPLISPQYLDRKPALTLIRTLVPSTNQLVIRLWDSHIKIKENEATLWVGVIGLIPRSYDWLLHKSSSIKVIKPTTVMPHGPVTEWELKIIVKPYKDRKGKTHPLRILLLRPKS